jgi:hypothetical protein
VISLASPPRPPPTQQLLPGSRSVRDTQLQTSHRARRHLVLRRQVPNHDRAARAERRQLCDVHLFGAGVMVEGESDLVPVDLGYSRRSL